MLRFQHDTEILHDLMNINRECSHTFHALMPEIGHRAEAATLVNKLAHACNECMAELRLRIDPTCGDPADAISVRGDIYRSWQSNATVYFSRNAELLFSQLAERLLAIRRAYETALQSSKEFTSELRSTLELQLNRIQETYRFVQVYNRKKTAEPAGAY